MKSRIDNISHTLHTYVQRGYSFGCFEIGNAWTGHDWHQHSAFQLFHMARGRGKMLIGDCMLAYRQGDVCFLGSGLPHSICPSPRNQQSAIRVVFFERSFLGERFFDLVEARPLRRLLDLSDKRFHVTGACRQTVAGLVGQLFASHGFDKLLKLLSILNALANTDKRSPICTFGYEPEQGKLTNERIVRVFAYIQRHFHERITLAEVAAHAHMTPEAFSRFFHAKTKRTLRASINEVRTSEVCKRLLTCDQDITSIAFACGYSNLSNFNRQFKKMTGKTPSEYRRQ